MRVAVISDIHGNRAAFDAVLADLRNTAPDLVVHGGDLAHNGSNPAQVVDQIRDLGWRGVLGNVDEMMFRPEALEEFAAKSEAPPSLWAAIREIAAFTRDALGPDRIAWLHDLPRQHIEDSLAVVHASPSDLWRSPLLNADDTELERVYGPLERPVLVYGHIHRGFVRTLPSGMVIANSGSVGLPYDGDPRASYALIEDQHVTIRRVEYDIESEVRQLVATRVPHFNWIAGMLRTGAPSLP